MYCTFNYDPRAPFKFFVDELELPDPRSLSAPLDALRFLPQWVADKVRPMAVAQDGPSIELWCDYLRLWIGPPRRDETLRMFVFKCLQRNEPTADFGLGGYLAPDWSQAVKARCFARDMGDTDSINQVLNSAPVATIQLGVETVPIDPMWWRVRNPGIPLVAVPGADETLLIPDGWARVNAEAAGNVRPAKDREEVAMWGERALVSWLITPFAQHCSQNNLALDYPLLLSVLRGSSNSRWIHNVTRRGPLTERGVLYLAILAAEFEQFNFDPKEPAWRPGFRAPATWFHDGPPVSREVADAIRRTFTDA